MVDGCNVFYIIFREITGVHWGYFNFFAEMKGFWGNEGFKSPFGDPTRGNKSSDSWKWETFERVEWPRTSIISGEKMLLVHQLRKLMIEFTL